MTSLGFISARGAYRNGRPAAPPRDLSSLLLARFSVPSARSLPKDPATAGKRIRIRFGVGRHYGRRVGLARPASVRRCSLRFVRIARDIPILHVAIVPGKMRAAPPHFLISLQA